MKIVIACDHRGFDAKQKVSPALKSAGHDVEDLGCHSREPCDYPDIAVAAARKLSSGEADIGILLDNSGIGMSVAANKVRGVRAALAHDEVTARIARAHNHCNVLCIGCDLVTDDQMRKIVETFLAAQLEGGRHERRVAKVNAIQQ